MKKLLLFVSLTILLLNGTIFSQGGKNLPSIPFGPSNSGKDYWFSFPHNWEFGATIKYCRLYITAGTRTKVTISIGTSKILKSLFTVPYDIITYDLSNVDAQYGTVRDDNSPIPNAEVYPNKAIHVESVAPIVVYGMNRTSFTSDGMLILPTNGLGKEYLVASAAEIGTTQRLPSEFVIVSPYDETDVLITLPSDQKLPNYSGSKGPFNISMNKGDVFGALSDVTLADLTGTLIQSSKPVAVMSGQNCTYLPDARFAACDHIEEMMLPVSAWGKLYHSIPFATRIKTDMYRIFAGEDNTTVSINGTVWGKLPKKGGKEGEGWFNYLHNKRELIEFTGDKPIYIAQYNNSQNWDGVESDPFMLVLTPVEQYQNQLIFTTPSADFPKNYVNFVCDSAGYNDIEIAQGGTDKWESFPSKFGFDVKKFPTKINGVTYIGKTIAINPGTYRVRGPKPFAGYIYGFGSFDSYGYPLSVAVGDLSRPDKDAPVIKDTIDCFGNYEATTTDLPDDSKIRSNISTIDLDPDATYNYSITVADFIPGTDREVKYSLKVIDLSQNAQAVVIISDQAGNYTIDTIQYNAFNVTITPSPVNFGTLFPGVKVVKKLTITNLAEREVKLKNIQLQRNTPGFKILSPIGGFTLSKAGDPGSSIVAQIEFTSTTNGKYEDSVGIENECNKKYISLIKAKVGAPLINVTDKDFGTLIVNTTSPAYTIEVSNPIDPALSDAILTVTGAKGPKKLEFKLVDGMLAFPFDLAPGESKTLRITFSPGSVASYLDTIVFSSNATGVDSLGILQGKGIQPQLIATNYDWGRKRVGTGWYTGKVMLKNYGTAPAIIRGLLASTGDINDFRLPQTTLDALSDLNISANDSVGLDVEFNPTTTAGRQMVMNYNVVQGPSGVKSTLDGFGTRPGLITQDYDYGTMEVGTTVSTIRDVEFQAVGQYLDSVTITEWEFSNQTPENDYSSSESVVNVKLATPIVLKPGNTTYTMKGSFIAKAVGQRVARMKAITLDGVDTTSKWSGNGFSLSTSIVGKGANADNICAPKDTILNAEVSNSGQKDVKVLGLKLIGLSGDFSLVSGVTSFTLKPGEKRQIGIKYSPSKTGKEVGKLEVTHDAGTPTSPMLLDISGSSYAETISSGVVLTGTRDNKGEIGGKLGCVVSLLGGFSNLVDLKSIQLTINYDPVQLSIDESSIQIGGAGVSYTKNNLSKAGIYVIDVQNPGGFTTSGELLKFNMDVQLTEKLEREIDVKIITNQGCTTINPSTTKIDIYPICGLSLRAIELINGTYTLSQNVLNPFNPSTKIKYSIGLEGRTEIVLQNMEGKEIQRLVSEDQKAGNYELTVDVGNLPSGNYYYTIKSGVWTETKMMTVVK
ncbi:MAG: choice-of-anchor D domain-containing protein [Chlorobi bacterium]|nr:choice-of-anchor D domain-containing protein [Chlorobiota bacterium]